MQGKIDNRQLEEVSCNDKSNSTAITSNCNISSCHCQGQGILTTNSSSPYTSQKCYLTSSGCHEAVVTTTTKEVKSHKCPPQVKQIHEHISQPITHTCTNKNIDICTGHNHSCNHNCNSQSMNCFTDNNRNIHSGYQFGHNNCYPTSYPNYFNQDCCCNNRGHQPIHTHTIPTYPTYPTYPSYQTSIYPVYSYQNNLKSIELPYSINTNNQYPSHYY